MSTSKDFLREMKKAGEAYSGGGGQGIIGPMMVEFGLHRYVAGHEFWSFWKATNTPEEVNVIGEELQVRLQNAGCSDSPSFGLRVTIKKDVLNGKSRMQEPEEVAEGQTPLMTTAYKRDLIEFIPAWQKDSYDLLVDSIDKNGLPVGELFYGQAQYKANPFFVKQGEAGKKDVDQQGNPRYPSIRVPVQRFANEAAAKAFVDNGDSQISNIKWSSSAQESFGAEGPTETLQAEILKWFEEAKKGKPYSNDAESYAGLPNKPTEDEAKEYIAGIYEGIETEDIATIVETLVPF